MDNLICLAGSRCYNKNITESDKFKNMISRYEILKYQDKKLRLEIFKSIIKNILIFILIILALDLLGFMSWVILGQKPVDNFFLGNITTHILKLII